MVTIFILLSAIAIWVVTSSRRRTGLLSNFRGLLEDLELVDDAGDWLTRRSLLKGEFRGRKVVILLQQADEEPTLVVSMETHAYRTMDTYDFANYQGDRQGEVALFALEVKHQLTLRLMDGYLKAQCQPPGSFPRVFNRSKWQSMLEAMHTLARLDRATRTFSNDCRRGLGLRRLSLRVRLGGLLQTLQG